MDDLSQVAGFGVGALIQMAAAQRLGTELQSRGSKDWARWLVLLGPLVPISIGILAGFNGLAVAAFLIVSLVLVVGIFAPATLIALSGGPKPIVVLATKIEQIIRLVETLIVEQDPAVASKLRELVGRLKPIDRDTTRYVEQFREIVIRWVDELPKSAALDDEAARLQTAFMARLRSEGIDMARLSGSRDIARR